MDGLDVEAKEKSKKYLLGDLMKPERKIELIKEAIDDWSHMNITDRETVIIISVIIGLKEPTEKDIGWAQKKMTEYLEKNQSGN